MLSLSLLLLLMQAAANLPPIAFDLATVKPSPARPGCAAGTGTEIVVCGKAGAPPSYRVSRDREFEEVPRVDIGLFGHARMAVGTQHAEVGGFPSNRIMAHVTIPF